MNQAAIRPNTVVRVSVVSDDRKLDVAMPAGLALVEIIPGFARRLGVLDPSMVHGGFELHRADGTALDQSVSASAQGVVDGDVLTLVHGVTLTAPVAYDDVTEAVIDAAADQHRPWLAADTARTALAVSLTFLGLSAAVLFVAGPEMSLAGLIAGGATLLLLVAAAVLAHVGQHESAHSMGLAAAVFAAIGGYLAVTSATPWGWSLAVAGLAAILAGAVSAAVVRERREIHLVSIIAGAALAIPAAITGGNDEPAMAAFVMTVALAGALGNLTPWLAFTTTRIKVISPQNEMEIFADPPPLDPDAIKARALAGTRVLSAVRLGLGVAVIVVVALVAPLSTAAALLCAAVFLGMMFQSRQAYAKSVVAVVMAVGTIGLAVTLIAVTLSVPDLRGVMLTVLAATSAALVSLTVLSPRARLRMTRVADVVEIAVLSSVLPLGVIAAGWV